MVKLGTDRLDTEVAAALRRAGYSGNDSSLLVSVSGGADSTALIHCLSRIKDAHRLRLHVAHLNHKLRGDESDRDAQFVLDLARELGLEATIEEGDVLAYRKERRISSLEQASREFRYRFLAQVAGTIGATAVVVAHTADDLAETILLHIMRGSGASGLRGMTELSPWPWPNPCHPNPCHNEECGLMLFRPLLSLSKADTLGYCRELGKDYREDSSNSLPDFTRNRIRLNLLPLLESEFNPKVREALVRLSQTTSLELDYMDGETNRLWGQVAMETNGGVDFRQPELAQAHPALQKLLLRKAYSHIAGDTRRLSQRHLEAMAGLVQSSPAGRSLDLPGGLKLHRSYNYLRLSREPSLPCPFPKIDQDQAPQSAPQSGDPITVKSGAWEIAFRLVDSSQIDFKGGPSASPPPVLGSESWTAYFDREAIGKQFRMRHWLPGDRFHPLGLAGKKKLQDFFTDAGIPRDWRKRVPLLVTERGIAWVVGYRIAHWTKVDTNNLGPDKAIEVTFSCCR